MIPRRLQRQERYCNIEWLTRWLVGVLACLSVTLACAAPLSATQDPSSAIGLSTGWLVEASGKLELSDAAAALRAGQFSPGARPILNFGIASKPAWIHFAVDNPTQDAIRKRLSIGTAWLDRIDVFVRHRGQTVARYRVGDRLAHAQRPVADRFFVFDHDFEAGTSDVFLRVETPDPMVVPIFLADVDTSVRLQTMQELSYGIVYGFLLALMAYNAMLYTSLRSTRYLFYSAYLAMFVAMNIAYTGHGFQWFWPDSPTWQQWSNPVLMVLYGVSGLLFAIKFLELRVSFPRVRRVVLGFCVATGALLAIAMMMGSQIAALLVAFSFVFLFSGLMLFLGAISVLAGQKPARYFLFASLAAMVGALLTTLSVWGFIPYNSWTFRAVEIGMLIDATLLALALAYQLRIGHEQRLRAERLAQMDPLTGLNNRRAFYDKARPLWSHAIRHRHDTSVILLDIDLFKQINDTLGHAHGDEVLKALAGILKQSVREGDVAARWGGEEFIVFLPETSIQEAAWLAERLRADISDMRVPHDAGVTRLTASFGVAQKSADHPAPDALIAEADACLLQSKLQGRNQVTVCQAGLGQGELDLSKSPDSPHV